MRILYLIPLLFAAASIAPAEEAATDSPRATVEKLQSALIASMKEGDKLDFDARYAKLEGTITEAYDFAVVGRVALGKNWGKLDEAQRTAFLKAFSKLGVGMHAANFKAFSGEQFKYVSEKPGERGQVIVRSVLIKGDGGEVKFDFILAKKGDAWRIINTIADGASDLAMKRAEFESIMSKEGFDSLLKKVEQKFADLKTAPAP